MKIEEFKNLPGIYKMSVMGTDKLYIGESVNVKQRLTKHIKNLRKGIHSNPILQNIYNKYGEDAFSFDILEYVEVVNDELLKRLEKDWQEKFPTCISLDSNKYNNLMHLSSRKEIYKEKARNTIQFAINACKKPIVIYDIIDDKIYELEKVTDGFKYIERKHLLKCLKSEYKVAFKNRYIAYYKSEFTSVDHSKIIKSFSDSTQINSTNILYIYNLLTGVITPCSSKSQVSKFLNFNCKSSNLYNRLINENIIWWNYESCIRFNKKNIFNASINITSSIKKSKKVNLISFYNCLKTNPTLIDLEKTFHINRSTFRKAFKERSIEQWINDIEKILSTLPE